MSDVKEELKQKLIDLQNLDSQLKITRNAFHNNTEFKQISTQYKDARVQYEKVIEKLGKLDKKIRFIFTEDGEFPFYGTGSWVKQTNIRQEVFDVMRKMSYAKSKLKHSQVEELVRQLIYKERNENKDYINLTKNLQKYRETVNRLEKKMWDLEREKLGKLTSARSKLAKEVRTLEDKVAHPHREEQTKTRLLALSDGVITKIYNRVKELREVKK